MIVMVMTVLAMPMMTDIMLNDDSESDDFNDENIVAYDKNDNNDDDGDNDDNDDDDGDEDDNSDNYEVGDDSRPPQLFSALSDCLLLMI